MFFSFFVPVWHHVKHHAHTFHGNCQPFSLHRFHFKWKKTEEIKMEMLLKKYIIKKTINLFETSMYDIFWGIQFSCWAPCYFCCCCVKTTSPLFKSIRFILLLVFLPRLFFRKKKFCEKGGQKPLIPLQFVHSHCVTVDRWSI